jgi:hypothetical protein
LEKLRSRAVRETLDSLREAHSLATSSDNGPLAAESRDLLRSSTVAEQSQRDRLLSGTAQLHAGTEHLSAACRTAHEAESTGEAILQTLAMQREQLVRARAGLAEGDRELSQSEAILKRMGRWWNGLLG